MTSPNVSGATHMLPMRYSRARGWRDLRDFVHDALADAMHHPTALDGARAHNLSLLISERHLGGVAPREMQRQLEILSGELRHLGVPHAIHRVLSGDAEPMQHQLRITLQRP